MSHAHFLGCTNLVLPESAKTVCNLNSARPFRNIFPVSFPVSTSSIKLDTFFDLGQRWPNQRLRLAESPKLAWLVIILAIL